MRILLIESNAMAANYLQRILREAGHVVDVASSEQDGLFCATEHAYNIVVADRLRAGDPGVDIVRSLKQRLGRCPLLVVSALADVDERVRGLRAGADDYLAKPFSFSELLARIEALVRRREQTLEDGSMLRVADLTMNLMSRRVYRGELHVDVTVTEFRILECLMRKPDQVVSRAMLMELAWDQQFEPATNIIDVHMCRIRRKVDTPGCAPMVETVRGFGYRLRGA